MSLSQPEIEPKAIGDKLKDIRSLGSNPGWKTQMEPMLEELEREFIEAAIDPEKTQEKRAEFIQGIQAIRKIRAYPKDKEAQLEASWKLQQQKKPTA